MSSPGRTSSGACSTPRSTASQATSCVAGGGDLALLAGGVLVGHLAIEDNGGRRDARVRMNAEQRPAAVAHFAAIEEHERLDRLADPGRTDEPGNRAVLLAERTQRDAA